MDEPASISVWLDDRHAIFRLGMAACLTARGCVLVGESKGFRPVPVLRGTDILVFECTGSRLRHAVTLAAETQTRLVAVVQSATESEITEMVGAGVDGVLFRDDLTCDVVSGYIHAVASGSTSMPQDVFRRLVLANPLHAVPPGRLTDRERSVLRLLAEGSDTHQIAISLCFSDRTIKNVVHDILMKLNCRTRAHAVAQATRAGVI